MCLFSKHITSLAFSQSCKPLLLFMPQPFKNNKNSLHRYLSTFAWNYQCYIYIKKKKFSIWKLTNFPGHLTFWIFQWPSIILPERSVPTSILCYFGVLTLRSSQYCRLHLSFFLRNECFFFFFCKSHRRRKKLTSIELFIC